VGCDGVTSWNYPIVTKESYGAIVPWLFLGNFLISEPAQISNVFELAFANKVDSAVAADLFISMAVFFVFVFSEGGKLGSKYLWSYILATLLIGLSFSLPLFLYNRARKLEADINLK
jgi:hypothetical protein